MTKMSDSPSNTGSVNPTKLGRSSLARLLLASAAAFVVVFLATVAVGGRGYSWSGFIAPTVATLILSLTSGAISALLVRRNDALLILLAQSLTVVAIGVWNFLA